MKLWLKKWHRNVGYHVRISKYKNIFAKVYTLNWSQFVIKKVKNTVPDHLNGEKIIGTFYEKELQKKQNKKNLGKEMEANYMLNQKVAIIHLIAGLMKNNVIQK